MEDRSEVMLAREMDVLEEAGVEGRTRHKEGP